MTLKRYILGISMIAALILSQAAGADSRNQRRGYSSHGNNSHSYRDYSRNPYGNSYRNYGSRRNARRANSYHYGYPGRRDSSYVSLSFGSHYAPYRPRYRDRRFDSGNFLSGLVLGSLFSTPRYSSRDYSRNYSKNYSRNYPKNYPLRSQSTVVYRTAPAAVPGSIVYSSQPSPIRSVSSGRRLLRDLEGNCFERIADEEGNEIRLQLDAQECNF